MARPSNTEERRLQITRALQQVMAKQGYEGAAIADIARAAGLTPGLVHYHFAHKREILLATAARLLADHQQRLQAQLALAGPSPRAQLLAFVEAHLGQGATADPEALACWIQLTAESFRDKKLKAQLERAARDWRDVLQKILVEAEAGGERVRPDPEAAAAGLLAVIQGYFVLAATARGVIPPGSAAATAQVMIDGLLSPKPRSRR
ncbi:MAG: TetR family transcriptional regulator C-terminal domain-containing protein [Deltaproteobacteria bacterium]|jgi:TetR/AcrR family transcriptional repressor of bet genes|nr:TetR family transcriptional regulator C-terminal domain-containing protein [Deltaproteobacteria bacterium]